MSELFLVHQPRLPHQLPQLKFHQSLTLQFLLMPSQFLLDLLHYFLRPREVHSPLPVPALLIFLPQGFLEMPVLLIPSVVEVDPSHQVGAGVHVQQQVPPLLFAVLQFQKEVVESADVG